eukprot:980655-Prorocentrum_minimum.AAC.1
MTSDCDAIETISIRRERSQPAGTRGRVRHGHVATATIWEENRTLLCAPHGRAASDGSCHGYILSPLLRLVPATSIFSLALLRLVPAVGIFSLAFCDWCPLR